MCVSSLCKVWYWILTLVDLRSHLRIQDLWLMNLHGFRFSFEMRHGESWMLHQTRRPTGKCICTWASHSCVFGCNLPFSCSQMSRSNLFFVELCFLETCVFLCFAGDPECVDPFAAARAERGPLPAAPVWPAGVSGGVVRGAARHRHVSLGGVAAPHAVCRAAVRCWRPRLRPPGQNLS